MSLAAVVLAAGLSTRMGRSKMLLDWGDESVIEHVVTVIRDAGIKDVIVVVGRDRELIERALCDKHAKLVFNPRYDEDSMVLSLQVGIDALPKDIDAVMIVLGDQPQIQKEIVRELVAAWEKTKAGLVVPSYRRRRGHPWIIARSLWVEVMQILPPVTLRDFLGQHAHQISYVKVDQESILKDIDTPDEYVREKPWD